MLFLTFMLFTFNNIIILLKLQFRPINILFYVGLPVARFIGHSALDNIEQTIKCLQNTNVLITKIYQYHKGMTCTSIPA